MSKRAYKRKYFFINDRVKAALSLLFIMAATLLMVFGGLEMLLKLPDLTAEQRHLLTSFRYPLFFKLTLSICWGFIAVLSAYMWLLHRYLGFFNRMRLYCLAVVRKDINLEFFFRKGGTMKVMEGSLKSLIKNYQESLKSQSQKLSDLKNDLERRLN